jgi:O-antigen ligase
MVIDWTNEEPVRQLVGSGFGNDFLAESGTKAFLEGTTYTNVRSPHNWFVGIYARMGLVGLALALAVIGQAGWAVWKNRRRIGADPVLAISALVIASILPVASLGVVLEAPFGAVPFFWALGVIHALGWPRPTTGEDLIRRTTSRPDRLSRSTRHQVPLV